MSKRSSVLQPTQPEIKTEEFLPPVSRWVRIGSIFIVLALLTAAISSFLVKYQTTVKVAAVVRPAGEPRLIQSASAGTVVKIVAVDNTRVEKGDAIAYLNTTGLDAQATQLLANYDQSQARLQQIKAQMISVDQQIAAEAAQSQRTVAASAADFQEVARSQQNQVIAAQADVIEAQTQIDLAQQEVESYGQLVDSGAIARLQLVEKQVALEAAQARMLRLKATLNPSTGDVRAAQQRIAEAQAGGVATVARLQQAKQELARQMLEIGEQLKTTEQEIAQVMLGLQNSVVRSPTGGTLHESNIRNVGQVLTPGETIAKVIPNATSVQIRARVPAEQINKVDIGMTARMRISACPFSEYGTVPGEVAAVSPDTLTQPSASPAGSAAGGSTGASYSVLINPLVTQLQSTAGNTDCILQPGTEGRVTIISREETVITFLRRKAGLISDF